MLSQKELKDILQYDGETGIFIKRPIFAECSPIEVGTYEIDKGYIRIGIKGKYYRAHRLAWLYVYGYFPENDIDHKNGNKIDNRIANLREVSKLCNMQNQKIYKNNKSGYPGVYFEKSSNKWACQATLRGKHFKLGRFSDALEAALIKLTWEVWCCEWHCNIRSKLTKAIKKEWPSFNLNSTI